MVRFNDARYEEDSELKRSGVVVAHTLPYARRRTVPLSPGAHPHRSWTSCASAPITRSSTAVDTSSFSPLLPSSLPSLSSPLLFSSTPFSPPRTGVTHGHGRRGVRRPLRPPSRHPQRPLGQLHRLCQFSLLSQVREVVPSRTFEHPCNTLTYLPSTPASALLPQPTCSLIIR